MTLMGMEDSHLITSMWEEKPKFFTWPHRHLWGEVLHHWLVMLRAVACLWAAIYISCQRDNFFNFVSPGLTGTAEVEDLATTVPLKVLSFHGASSSGLHRVGKQCPSLLSSEEQATLLQTVQGGLRGSSHSPHWPELFFHAHLSTMIIIERISVLAIWSFPGILSRESWVLCDFFWSLSFCLS